MRAVKVICIGTWYIKTTSNIKLIISCQYITHLVINEFANFSLLLIESTVFVFKLSLVLTFSLFKTFNFR